MPLFFKVRDERRRAHGVVGGVVAWGLGRLAAFRGVASSRNRERGGK